MAQAAPSQIANAPARAPDPRTLLFFVHIPKTGGTSFVQLLQTVYGRGFLLMAPGKRLLFPPRLYTKPMADGLMAISGHVPFGYHREFGASLQRFRGGREHIFARRDVKYISIVRDPVERVKSSYRFVMATPAHRLHRRTRGQSPEEFLRFLVESTRTGAGAINAQARLIGKGCRGDIEAIKRRIREDFHAVGVLEDIAPFVRHLADTLHWPQDVEMGHFNRTSRPPPEEDFAPALVAWIRDRNRLDTELYEFVRSEGRQYWKPA